MEAAPPRPYVPEDADDYRDGLLRGYVEHMRRLRGEQPR